MKKIAIIAAIASVFSIGTNAAGNGTINFTGNVTAQTCNAAIGGNTGTTPATVTLPTVQTSVLNASGAVAGQTAFSIGVTGCASTTPSGAGTVKAYFEKGQTVDANGRLTNTATTNNATNVVLQLIDGTTNNPINIGDASQAGTGSGYVTIASQSATLPYSVRYYATAQSTAGAVTSNVTYSLIYN